MLFLPLDLDLTLVFDFFLFCGTAGTLLVYIVSVLDELLIFFLDLSGIIDFFVWLLSVMFVIVFSLSRPDSMLYFPNDVWVGMYYDVVVIVFARDLDFV